MLQKPCIVSGVHGRVERLRRDKGNTGGRKNEGKSNEVAPDANECTQGCKPRYLEGVRVDQREAEKQTNQFGAHQVGAATTEQVGSPRLARMPHLPTTV